MLKERPLLLLELVALKGWLLLGVFLISYRYSLLACLTVNWNLQSVKVLWIFLIKILFKSHIMAFYILTIRGIHTCMCYIIKSLWILLSFFWTKCIITAIALKWAVQISTGLTDKNLKQERKYIRVRNCAFLATRIS